MNAYTATEEHMRMNYIASERRRNTFHGPAQFQTDEELGEEFDQGMARIKAELRAEIAADLRNSCDVRDLDAPDVICHLCERAATIAEGALGAGQPPK